MPYSEGIYEDMNAVIAWQHYWNASSNANDTLREYVSFEFSAAPQDVDDVMEAIGLLEQTWPTGSVMKMQTQAARAFALLQGVDGRLSAQAKGAWRWRILLLRAELDATLAANGDKMYGPVLCKDFDELRAIQHVNGSERCGVPQAPCSKPPPGPPPGTCSRDLSLLVTSWAILTDRM